MAEQQQVQSKGMFGLFRADGTLHTIVDCPGATICYDDSIYEVVEADDIDTVLEGKPTPTTQKLTRVLPDANALEIKTIKTRLGKRDLSPVEISK